MWDRNFLGLGKERDIIPNYEPEVTFVIPAYNEERWIADKIANSLALKYPKEKLHFLLVTDGSNDRTMDLIDNYPLLLFLQMQMQWLIPKLF